MRIVTAALLLSVTLAASGQQDQTPRQSAAVNRDYYDLAAATGGDFYFWMPGEFATSKLQIPIDRDDVLLAYGTLHGKRTYEIPIESGVRSLSIFAGAEKKNWFSVIRPDGTAIPLNDPSVQTFQRMLIVTINAPAAGTWKLEMDGSGLYCATARVAADLQVGSSHKECVAPDGTTVDCDKPPAHYRVVTVGTDINGKAFRRVESSLK